MTPAGSSEPAAQPTPLKLVPPRTASLKYAFGIRRREIGAKGLKRQPLPVIPEKWHPAESGASNSAGCLEWRSKRGSMPFLAAD